jgi:hypothetical protein
MANDDRLLDRIRTRLGAKRLAGAIVYVMPKPRPGGEPLAVGDVVINIPWSHWLAFVDLEPQANWGHSCIYIGLRVDDETLAEYPAHMPPFLKADASDFKLLWYGPRAPVWAVAAEPLSEAKGAE